MDERSGMGAKPSGPSFAPWFAAPPSAPGSAAPDPPVGSVRSVGPVGPVGPVGLVGPPPRSPQPPQPIRPPGNPWPTLLTVLAIVVVGVVVVVSSVLSGATPEVRPAASRVLTPVSAAPTRSDRMEFVSDDGDGVLIVTSSGWATSGIRRPLSGSYLHVELQLVCTAGELSYGPENFSAFDAAGELFEVTTGDRWGTPLGYGTLSAGQSVRGTIAFDLPRGEVTLLMSDSTSRSVTALKIPD